MARLVVSDEARNDVAQVLWYLRREAGNKVALEYSERFEQAADLLVEFPGMGRPRPELGTDARSLVVKPYIIIYDHNPSEDAVTLLRVVHGRRNITADLIRRR